MSAFPPKADIDPQSANVRFVPKADIAAWIIEDQFGRPLSLTDGGTKRTTPIRSAMPRSDRAALPDGLDRGQMKSPQTLQIHKLGQRPRGLSVSASRPP